MKLTIKEWRRAKEISQERMASLCGVHINTYRAWEENPEDIRIGKAVLISDILGIPLEDILFTR
jgi:transcriptional regulator with XRE-family HTH domain